MELPVVISLMSCTFGLGAILAGIFGYYISYLINRAKASKPRRGAVLKDTLVEISKQISEVNKGAHEKTMQFKECAIEIAIETETQTSGSSKSEIPQIYVLEWGGSLKQSFTNKITLKYEPISGQLPPQATSSAKIGEDNLSDYEITDPNVKTE